MGNNKEEWKEYCNYEFNPGYCLKKDPALHFIPLDVTPGAERSGRPFDTYMHIDCAEKFVRILQVSKYDDNNYRAYKISPVAALYVLIRYNKLEHLSKLID